MALLERNLGSSGRRLLQLVQDYAAREPVRATFKGLVHHGRHSRSKFVANHLRDQVYYLRYLPYWYHTVHIGLLCTGGATISEKLDLREAPTSETPMAWHRHTKSNTHSCSREFKRKYRF